MPRESRRISVGYFSARRGCERRSEIKRGRGEKERGGGRGGQWRGGGSSWRRWKQGLFHRGTRRVTISPLCWPPLCCPAPPPPPTCSSKASYLPYLASPPPARALSCTSYGRPRPCASWESPGRWALAPCRRRARALVSSWSAASTSPRPATPPA